MAGKTTFSKQQSGDTTFDRVGAGDTAFTRTGPGDTTFENVFNTANSDLWLDSLGEPVTTSLGEFIQLLE